MTYDYDPSDELRYVNIIRIKVVDHRGHTIRYLMKKTGYGPDGAVDPDNSESWSSPPKPLKDRPDGAPFQRGRAPRSPVARSGDHLNLLLPGLTVNLKKLAPQLDRFAAAYGLVDESGAVITCNDRDAAPTLTVDQLHRMYKMR